MVQQISALIVQPVLDASKYSPGAQEKVAADKAMTVSTREVGVAAVDTSAKINQSGDVLARLSRQYVDGYAAEQRFAQGLNQINRGLETGKISMEGAERILIGMNQRLGITADAAQLAAKGQNELAAAVTRANVQIERQATELAEAAAASGRFQAANSNTISHGARQAAGFNAGQQLQDIAMMSILGQAPGTLALQQGPALASAIQQGGGLAALGAGLGSLLSVTTLLTIGFTAATAATIQWFTKGKDGAKDLDEALKSHSATLSRLKQQYGELGDASKNIGGPVGGAAYTEAQARSEVDTIQAAIRAQSGDLSKQFIGGGFLRSGMFGSNTGGLDTLLSTRNSPFQDAVDGLLKSIRDGNGGLEKFDANLNKIFDDLRGKSSDPAKLNEEMRRLSDAALDAFSVTGKMSPFQGEIDRLLLGLKEGNGDLSTFATNVRRIGELNGIGKQADDVILTAKEVVGLAEKLREVEQILRRIDQENTRPGLRDQRDLQRYVAGRNADARILDQQFDAAQQLARARTNAERLAAVEAQVRARAKEDGDSGGGLQARVNRALAEERTRQEVDARDAASQRSQSIERSLQQQRLQLDLIGKTGGEQAKLTYEFERMQELREQAARTGEPIDQKEVANIKAAAEAMGMYADALARAKMGDDLSFESDQLHRTSQDQQIAARLRSANLPVDLNGQFAQQMRANDTYADARDSAAGFVRTFGDELINSGGDIGKSLGRAIENALLDATSKAWEKLADQLGIAFANWLTGSSGSGGGATSGAGGIIASLLGSGGANDNFTAPAGTVTRAPLADIGSALFKSAGVTKTGIPLSQIGAQGLTAKVNSQYAARFQGLLSDLTAAGYPISSLGEGGYSYRNVAGSSHLSNHAFGNAIDINPRQNPWAVGAKGNFAQYGVDPNELAQKNGLFWGGNWNKSDAMHFQVDKTAASLDKLSTSSVQTAQNLSGGLGKLGTALNQFPAAPSGGGGGLLGSLGGLLGGGLSSLFSGTKAFNWLSANPGGYIGLYHDGGIAGSPTQMRYAPHSLFRNAPRFHEGTLAADEVPAILRRGEPVFKSMDHARQVVGANTNSRSPQKVELHVHVTGGTGNEEVRRMALAGGRQAIAENEIAQRRGGFGATQRRYNSNKN